MQSTLFISIVIFLVFLFALGFWSKSRVHSEADFIVAGRKFNLWLSVFSLFATWFGAGTLITATDEIRSVGLRAAALEPLGAGLCLIIAGMFFAKPLWRLNIYTISDFYRIRFGEKTEKLSVALTIPAYAGWIAVQFMALSELLHSFFGWPVLEIVLVLAFLSMVLTMTGGLWSVTITDSLELGVIIIGLLVLAVNVFSGQGENGLFYGFFKLWNNAEESLKVVVPHENSHEVLMWTSVLMVSALGNISGQDLVQRIFAAKSSKVAKNACIISGVAYVLCGAIPALLGIFSHQIFKEGFEGTVVSHYAEYFMSPSMKVVFVLCIFATVFSTITSAILSPSSILAHNYLKQKFPKVSTLKLCQMAVAIMTLLSVAVVFLGKNVYEILESSYALGLVCFFAPLFYGLFTKMHDEKAALTSMFVGTFVWCLEFIVVSEFPFAMVATVCSLIAYYLTSRLRCKPNLSCDEPSL